MKPFSTLHAGAWIELEGIVGCSWYYVHILYLLNLIKIKWNKWLLLGVSYIVFTKSVYDYSASYFVGKVALNDVVGDFINVNILMVL